MKVILISAMSVNGNIGRSSEHSSVEWTSKEDTKFFVDQTKEAGVVVMGRKTFETIGRSLPGRLIVVMTRKPELYSVIDGVEYTNKHAQEILKDLRARGFSSVVIAGGSEVYSMFLQEKLVTDLYLTIEPILFGNGVPLVEFPGDVALQFVETYMLGLQSVLLHYRVV